MNPKYKTLKKQLKLRAYFEVNKKMAVYTIKSEFATSRRIAQITDTIEFEFVKNVKKLIILGLIAAVVFILNIAIQTLDVSRGIKLPTNPTDYITSYLGYFNFLTVIITITIGGSSIATEFEKLTGNVLFPKYLSGTLTCREIYRYGDPNRDYHYILLPFSRDRGSGKLCDISDSNLVFFGMGGFVWDYSSKLRCFLKFLFKINGSHSNPRDFHLNYCL